MNSGYAIYEHVIISTVGVSEDFTMHDGKFKRFSNEDSLSTTFLLMLVAKFLMISVVVDIRTTLLCWCMPCARTLTSSCVRAGNHQSMSFAGLVKRAQRTI